MSEQRWAPGKEPDMNHRPVPGPLYWEYLCRRCGKFVSLHPSFWKRIMQRFATVEGDAR